jgi:hypothetical protein
VLQARDRLRTLVTQVFDRAKAAGVVRDDVIAFDAPLIFMMLGAVMDRTRDVTPELWRRYLGLILDGLRPDAASALPHPALDGAQLDLMMGRKPT